MAKNRTEAERRKAAEREIKRRHEATEGMLEGAYSISPTGKRVDWSLSKRQRTRL